MNVETGATLSTVPVLIVDDDPDATELVRRALARSGLDAYAARSSRDAVALLRDQTFRAVLLDYKLPDGEPWEVLSVARARCPRVPVILVTALGSERVAAEALRRGADDYLSKRADFWDEVPELVRRVDEQTRAEQATARLAAIVQASTDAILLIAADGTIESWNPGAEQVYGWRADEIVGRPLTTLVPPDRADELTGLFARAAQGERITCVETVRVRKDGQRIDVSLNIAPIYGAEGALRGFSSIARALGDTRQLQAQIWTADRLAAVGTLAAGVAHEINNPLSYVVANLDFLAGELAGLWERAPDDRTAELARVISETVEGAERIRRVVRALGTFARTGSTRRVPIDVQAALDIALGLVGNEIRHRARLNRDHRPVPPVEGDEAHLAQVFVNLLTNAAHALPEGQADAHEVRIDVRDGGSGAVIVEIADTGSGIEPDVARRMFDPFFTTRPGVGSGLGLAIARAIVSGMGGAITFDSAPGRGSTFTLSLPVAPGVVTRPGRAPAPGRGRILVVDDEARVLTAIARVLADHEVVGVTRPAEALARLRAGERFDLCLCDVMMPEMTGYALHEQIANLAPELGERTLFMTGGAFTPEAREVLAASRQRLLEKPLDPTQLRSLVRQLLG